jgi:glycosyltransferase involved in cell wall biosynthesis
MGLSIIHVSNLSLNGSWFEKLVLTLHQRDISQNLITLNSSEVIFSSGIPEDMKIYSPKSSFRILRYVKVISLIRMATSKRKQNFLFAQGHEEAIVCSVAARILGIEFGLVHHVQPLFFPELMHRKRLKGLIHYELYKYYIRRASLIQSLSLDVTESLTRLGVHSNKIVCLAHGIDFEEFAEKITESKSTSRKLDHFPILLMVGRLSWEKNYPLALESFRRLNSEFKNAKLLIAGIGPMDTQLREMVNQYNLEKEVEFLGYVSNIPGLMIEADALLHLSLSESYGQIYVEACLADLPIISYPVGIIKELKDMNIPEITILSSKDPAVIAANIASLSENTLIGRKKHGFNPQPYAIHDERYVLQSIAKYLEDFGQRSI